MLPICSCGRVTFFPARFVASFLLLRFSVSLVAESVFAVVAFIFSRGPLLNCSYIRINFFVYQL